MTAADRRRKLVHPPFLVGRMMRLPTLLFASFVAAFSLPASAQAPLKLGLLLDMSGPYADIGGQGSVTAARMAVDDFGGKVLERPIEIVFADHQNKADLAGSLARQWFDDQGVETILDVAASGPALAVNEIAKQRSKILILNGPAARRLTNEDCAPYTVHYTYDNYALAKGTGEASVKAGYDSWFFITADNVFGKDLEAITSAFVAKNGGKVVGSVRAPLNTADFSSYLLQAQSSQAKVIGLANSGADTINAIKQAAEFGVGKSDQKLVALLVYITDVNSMGLEAAQGLLLTEAFYWDMNDETRAWSRRYFDKMKKMPNMTQAGVYSSTLHYLQAVKAAGTVESSAVMKMMKATPINDLFAHNGRIREDGRMVHDMYLFEVKKPSESKEPWDDYRLVATIPAEEAFQPLSQSTCPLIKK
jgi:branched-chain amino acid transport system substrate-binding protein